MKSLKTRLARQLRRLLAAPAASGAAAPLQIYPGYADSDLPLLRACASEPAAIAADHYIDGFGVKTLFRCVPFVTPATLDIDRLRLPVPDDGFHAEAIEYLALADAFQRSGGGGRNRWCAVEIGAGWGPWIGAAGVLARRAGIGTIQLAGVEADPRRFALMRLHLETNGLRPPGADAGDASHAGILTRLFNGAIWTHDGEIWFPETDVTDMGAAATPTAAATDYRGTRADHRAVPCRRLDTLLGDLGTIDFMHIDIQGAEHDLLQDQIDWVTAHVRTLMIATHSRVIEGRLIELLLARGWRLHREKPCRVDWQRAGDLVGRTVVDGSQYWLNPAYCPA